MTGISGTGAAGGESDWFRAFSPSPGAAVRLLCLPHAGGSAGYWFPAAKALAPGIEVLAVQYPGRHDRRQDPLVPEVSVLADLIADELAAYADRPLAVLGHSMGAVVGFEVVQRLEARGRAAVELFVSGRRAPSAVRGDQWHQVGEAELIAEIKSLGGAGSELLDDPEIRAMMLPVIRNDYRAVETHVYRPGARVSCPVTVLTGDADPKVTVDEAMAWQDHTTGAFRAEVFPGGHFYLADHLDAVLATVTAALTAPALAAD
ncbi:thioesterase II family protein [Streptomyces sp. NPDC012888]|uniref:thioesterase II family protein n=1 Tax=Streptomyces sp. NPDC012888 TaxID=3364855 RepID=UPI00367D56B4